MDVTLKEYITLFQKHKEVQAAAKALKEEMGIKKDVILEFMEERGMKSISFGNCVIKLKTTKSKPALNQAFLTDTLTQKISNENATELVTFILSEQDAQKKEKTDVQIKLSEPAKAVKA